MSVWQPIATAPKDGTTIILCAGELVETAHWHDNDHTSHPWKGWSWHTLTQKPGMRPTHWQPLPDPGSGLWAVDGRKYKGKDLVVTEHAKFEGWAVVEVFGHQRYAGFVTTEAFGQAVLFRVDVPPLSERERITKHYSYDDDGKSIPPGSTVKESAVQGYTKYFGPGAIYAMTPCTQESAEEAVASMQPRKVSVVSIPPEAATLPPHRDDDDDDDSGFDHINDDDDEITP